MFKMMRKRKAKGFTLVELLIVMVIIGILAGAMLLVMGSGKDKANATKIVSNLRSLKAAALMCYSDYGTWPTDIDSLSPYMDRTVPTSGDSLANYDVESTSNDFYIKAALGTDAGTGVQEKLADMADENGLYSDTSGTTYSSGSTVYVRVGSR